MARFFLFLLFIPVLSGCAGEVLKGQVETSRQREAILQKELVETKEFLAGQDQQNQQLMQQALLQRETIAKNAELSRMNNNLVATNKTLEAEVAELTRRYNDSLQMFRTQNVSHDKTESVTIIPNSGTTESVLKLDDPEIIPPRQVDNRIIIELQDDLLFESPDTPSPAETEKKIAPGDSSVTPGRAKQCVTIKKSIPVLSDLGKKRLEKVAALLLRDYSDRIITVTGHTAQVKNESATAPLLDDSLQKAMVVVNDLVTRLHVDPARMEIAGSGPARPVVSNETPENRKRNTRIEISIE